LRVSSFDKSLLSFILAYMAKINKAAGFLFEEKIE